MVTFEVLMGAAWLVIVALIGVIWDNLQRRIERLEKHNHDMRGELQTVLNKLPSEYERQEIIRQRDTIDRIFDKLNEMREDLHKQHLDVLEALSRKVDR